MSFGWYRGGIAAVFLAVFAAAADAGGTCVEGDCSRGSGVFLYPDGSRYEGSFSGGRPDGAGSIICPDGSAFYGQWKDGFRSGRGVSILPDGSEFEGPFENGLPSGTGLFTASNGRVKRAYYDKGALVRSEPVNFEKTGPGIRYGSVLAMGARYTGWFKGRRAEGYVPHGRGKITWEDGCSYSGQWKDGKMHGRGLMSWEDGSSYAGQWEEGRRSGFGTYTWKSGSRYMGGWKDNRKNGPGIACYSDGSVQQGTFRDDTFLMPPGR